MGYNLDTNRTGRRKLDAKAIQAARYCDAWHGVELDGPKKGQILAAAKAALPFLTDPRKRGSVRDFLDVLFKHSFEQDWRPGSRPIVWVSNNELAHQLGLTERSVQRLIRHVYRDLALIGMTDSPNGKRYGRRDTATREILYAYGFDLSPLAVRYDELARIGREGADRRKDAQTAKKRLSATRSRIYAALAALSDAGETGIDADAIALEADDFAARGRKLADPSQIKALAAALEDRLAELFARLEALEPVDESDNMSPKGDTDGAHITTTNPLQSSGEEQRIRRSPDGSQVEPSEARSPDRAKKAGRDVTGGAGGDVSPSPEMMERGFECDFTGKDLLEISPRLQYAVPPHSRSPWLDLSQAARRIAGEMGISRHAVQVAENAMTPPVMAACIAVIDAKSAEIGSPGGYLRAMTARHLEGVLDLQTTIYLLKKRRAH